MGKRMHHLSPLLLIFTVRVMVSTLPSKASCLIAPFSHLLPGTAAGKSPNSSQRSVGHVCSHMRREFETGACRRGLFSKGSAEDVLRGWGVERALCALVWVSPPWDTAGGLEPGDGIHKDFVFRQQHKQDRFFFLCVFACGYETEKR